MKKILSLLAGIALLASWFLAGCGGGGKGGFIMPPPDQPVTPTPTVNVPPDMRGVIVFNGPADLSSGKGTAIYALSASKGLEKVADGAGGKFSTDGNLLAYLYNTGQSVLVTTTPDGTQITRPIRNTVILDRNWSKVAEIADSGGDYTWSIAGDLFYGHTVGGLYRITRSWGKEVVVPPAEDTKNLSPAVSPDGSLLIWAHYEQGYNLAIVSRQISRLLVTDIEVTYSTITTRADRNLNLTFLDSNEIVFEMEYGEIWTSKVGSGHAHREMVISGLQNFKLSPDRSQLALLIGSELLVAKVGEWQPRSVGSNPTGSNAGGLAWSPRNDALAVTEQNHETTKTMEVILYDLRGGKKKIVSLPSNESRGYAIDWAS